MQIVINNIYKGVATNTNREYALVKSVGDSVFESLLKNIKKPKSLILKVRGIGSFYLRKQKLLQYIESYRRFYTDPTYETTIKAISDDAESYERKRQQYENFCERVEEYKEYSEKRKEIKQIRNLTQPIIEPKNDDQ